MAATESAARMVTRENYTSESDRVVCLRVTEWTGGAGAKVDGK